MKKAMNKGFATLCVHGNEPLDAQGGIHAPLYNHSTFGFPSTEALMEVVEGKRDGNIYTRYGMNPTIRDVERRLALLEGGEQAVVFGSGMAAESATFFAHCRTGDHIVCIGDLYGGTHDLLSVNLPSLGITTTFLLASEIDRLSEVVTDRTRIVYFETPTNPTMGILDITAISAIAKKNGALTVVDNTFASPVNQSPLALGADIVVHSATKYLGGHSDITGGVVIGASEKVQPIWTWRYGLGQTMAPEVAFLLARSLKTLAVRVRQQNENAMAVATFLDGHPRVRQVNYPGLASFPGHHLAGQQMRGYGGMISFVVDGNGGDAAKVVDRLKLFTIAVSLGGVESLVTQPVTTSHHDMAPEERERRGIVDSMIRLSCGLEDAEDLIADLQQALDG